MTKAPFIEGRPNFIFVFVFGPENGDIFYFLEFYFSAEQYLHTIGDI